MYCIYKITNKLNGKTYIGQHKYKDLSMDEYMGSGKLLWRAIEKYGIENFEREILISEIKTKNEINQLEKEYIKSERDLGHSEYNISDGGDGWNLSGENHPWYNKHLPKEMKDKISKSNKGKIRSDKTKENISKSHKDKHLSRETKSKMSESHRGINNAFYGKHHTEETKKILSESHRGRSHSEETKKKMSESTRLYQLGKKYYNNGIECHLYYPGTEPEGYILGFLKRSI